MAACVTDENPKGQPMLAPVAQQQGRLLGKNLMRLIQGEETEPFSYFNKGMMATVGRNKAVVDLPKWKFQGFFAWVIWMMVHILSLVGFKNKLSAFIGWASNYINYDRPLGLIIRNYIFYKKFNGRNSDVAGKLCLISEEPSDEEVSRWIASMASIDNV